MRSRVSWGSNIVLLCLWGRGAGCIFFASAKQSPVMDVSVIEIIDILQN